MKKSVKLSYLLLPAFAPLLLSLSCATPDEPAEGGIKLAHTSAYNEDFQSYVAGMEAFEEETRKHFARFLELRCLQLGAALIAVSSENQSERESGWRTIENLRRSKVGRILPGYIQRHLYTPDQPPRRRPDTELDPVWLGIQGKLLKAAYKFESLDRESWMDATHEMLTLGTDGRNFLTAQMIKRLTLADVKFVDLAQSILAGQVAEEAIQPLIDVTAVDLNTQPGVFPRRVADTLGFIGVSAVEPILKVYYNGDDFIPATDGTFSQRKYLAMALGKIGDPRAVRALALDLLANEIKSDNRRYIYEQYVIEALGAMRSEEAVEPILTAWRRDQYLLEYAQRALLAITGDLYVSPDKKR